MWLHGRTLHRRYPWSWTSEPEPEVCCRLQRPMKEYRLFVIGSVTTECTRQQMRKWKKKMLWGGWNVMWTVGFNHWTPQGCYRLPSMLLKAKGSLRPGCAVIRLIEWATTISSGTSRGSEFVKVNLSSGTSGRRVQRTTRNIQITQSAPDTRKDGVSRGEKKYLNRCA